MSLTLPEELTYESLCSALANDYASQGEIRTRRIAEYLYNYLCTLGSGSRDSKSKVRMVVEREYTDADFLDDFAEYYIRCYPNYSRRCKRLHFFKETPLAEDVFSRLVRGAATKGEEDAFRESYLGFVVARPLPRAVIGRTVLRTYESDGGRRNYTCTRKYPVNLYGISLSVDSLAFQEQDTVLAACATVALWSCFQKTAKLFDTRTPTPAAITTVAGQAIHLGRPIPSHGLISFEMCRAIRHYELEPELIDLRDRRFRSVPFISLLYGYLWMGLPVILGVEIEKVGRHAIALTGYSFSRERQHKAETIELAKDKSTQQVPLAGLHISALFGHDDQIGPFSRLKVISPACHSEGESNTIYLESTWIDPETKRILKLTPMQVIIPVYHKIRLTFVDVYRWVTVFLPALRYHFGNIEALEWDVHLTFSNDVKGLMRTSDLRKDAFLESLLVEHHPRFVWRAILKFGEIRLVELLFDATGFARSFPLYRVVWHNEDFASKMKWLLEHPGLSPILNEVESLRINSVRFWEFLGLSIARQFD